MPSPTSSIPGGQSLPVPLNSACLVVVARADASLMTIVASQGAISHDVQKYGTDEIRLRVETF